MSKQRSPLVIWGTSGHAAVVADIVRLEGRYEVVEFLDDDPPNAKYRDLCRAPVIGGRERLPPLHASGISSILIAVGHPQSRLRLSQLAADAGFDFATAVHPSAVIAADCRISAGTVVAAGAVINPGVTLGPQVIVNTSASIDHGCSIGEGATICPGARLAGEVTVGRAAWIGIGATVRERIAIGNESILGAGAVVVNDIPASSVAYGVPARVVRRVSE